MDYKKLLRENETPFFVFNRERLKKNYNEFKAKSSNYLENFKIFYSVKTNFYEKVLGTLAKKGCGFEIGSENELEMVEKFGNNIIFNSPCKKEFTKKAFYNVDSLSEMKRISKTGINEIGIRVSFNRSKFGIEPERIVETFKGAEKMGLNPRGISSHLGTQIKKVEDYKKYIKNLKKIAIDLEKTGYSLDFIDVGGGFPDKSTMKASQAELSDFLKTLKALDNYIIYLEPGRVLVSDAFELIMKVCYIKERKGKKYAICDAGINVLPKITLSRYKFEKISKKSGSKGRYILAGPLLFGNDIIHKGWYGNLKEGDYLKVKNVGAYCIPMAWRLSYKIPKIVEV